MFSACGGRLLIFPMQKLNKIAIWDVRKEAFVKYLSADLAVSVFGSGRDYMLVANNRNHSLERWSLKSFQREELIRLPFDDEVRSILIGEDSNRLALLVTSNTVHAVSIKKLSCETIQGLEHVSVSPRFERPPRISADGTTFILQGRGRLQAVRIMDSTARVAYIPAYAYAINDDGSVLATQVGIARPPDYKHAETRLRPMYYPIGQTNLAFWSRQVEDAGLVLTIVALREKTPVLQLKPIKKVNWRIRNPESLDRHVHYSIQYKKLILLDVDRKHIHVRHLDIEKQLRERHIEYLYVESNPKSHVRRNQRYQTKIGVKSSHLEVVMKLLDGPPGMTLSDNGVINWNNAQSKSERPLAVRVHIRNGAGLETTHTFEIHLLDKNPNGKATGD